jgi:hypothetical protein
MIFTELMTPAAGQTAGFEKRSEKDNFPPSEGWSNRNIKTPSAHSLI